MSAIRDAGFGCGAEEIDDQINSLQAGSAGSAGDCSCIGGTMDFSCTANWYSAIQESDPETWHESGAGGRFDMARAVSGLDHIAGTV